MYIIKIAPEAPEPVPGLRVRYYAGGFLSIFPREICASRASRAVIILINDRTDVTRLLYTNTVSPWNSERAMSRVYS